MASLAAAFPDSALLAREPGCAEWLDSTLYDQVAADVIAAALALTESIAALDQHPV